ncbi:MAG: DUF1127 domain-containing protein [Paracoccaceae bacterium]
MLTTGNLPAGNLTHLPPLSRAAVRLADLVVAWEVRQRSRKQLLRLDPRLLRDVGLDEMSAGRESLKPFWR